MECQEDGTEGDVGELWSISHFLYSVMWRQKVKWQCKSLQYCENVKTSGTLRTSLHSWVTIMWLTSTMPATRNAGLTENQLRIFLRRTLIHEHIRRNILLATRNFQFRVQTFIKTVVHNKMSEMKVKYHSFRTEFQMRGWYCELFGNAVNIYFYHWGSLIFF